MSPTRADAAIKVRGEAAFGPDLEAPGMLWGVLVPSPAAAGRLLRVDLKEARAQPDVVAVAAAEVARSFPGPGDPERPVFPRDEVSYRHQPVAAVAAPTLARARAAAAAVVVEVEPRPAVVDIERVFPEFPDPATAGGSPHVTAHVHARHGDVDAAIRAADVTLAETYRTSGIHQVAVEPHACLVRRQGEGFHVLTTTQSPYGVRDDLASLLSVPEDRLEVEGTWVGGGFGGKAAALLEPYATVLAAESGRPVKMVLSYREEFLLGRSTHPAVVRIESAVKDGRITGRRVRLLLDTGASMPGRDFATGFVIGFLAGPYSIPAIELEGYALRTNKPPFGPHRAPLTPQCAFVAESHMEALARRLGVDPIEFRLAHAWKEGDTTHLGQRVGPFGLVRALETLRATRDRWRSELPRDDGAPVGFGVGVGFWSTGTGQGGEARLRLTPTEAVVVEVEREIGSGSVIRGLSAVVERELGLPAEAVRVEPHSTREAPYDSGVYGSRTVGALGQAVQGAARALLEEIARRWPGDGRSLRLERSGGELIARRGSDSRPVRSLLTPEEREGPGLVTGGRHFGSGGDLDSTRVRDGSFYAYTDFTASVHLAQVAVDRETGQVRVQRYCAVQDVGVALDPAMVRAQVEGGVAMGLGTALTEEALWSEDGRLTNAGLLDYRVPTLGEVPPVDVEILEGFAGAGPYGAKGVGEPPIIPVPAAVANAVADATGARLHELPLTPERVARALMPLGGSPSP